MFYHRYMHILYYHSLVLKNVLFCDLLVSVLFGVLLTGSLLHVPPPLHNKTTGYLLYEIKFCPFDWYATVW